MTATRAHRFGNIMAGPSSSFWKASSARLVGDSMRVRPWNPPSGPRPLLDDYAGERLCHPMTTSAGHSLASDAVHQQWCLAPAALPVRPPTVLRMLRPGPRALAIPTRDCTYINRRDIIAAFSGSGGTIAMTPTHHTPLSFVQLLVMACWSCGAITSASAAMTATRAHRFGNIMAGPSSSFRKASSARLVGDSMRVRPWNPPSGPRPLLDDYAGERLCHPMTTSAGHSLASDAVHQQWCLAPAALPVRPPTVLRMLRPGPRALAIPTRDCTYINRRDIIAAFSGSGGTIAMTPTHHTPLSLCR
ncbi:hypothetical protein MRX96_015411 [Rhipicephalus microplus]